MRQLGAPEDVVSRIEDAHWLDEEVEVLACNWDAVNTYQHCQLTLAVGGNGPVCFGISAQEAHQAASMLLLPRDMWPGVLRDVQAMGRIAANLINGSQT